CSCVFVVYFFFSSRSRHTSFSRDWSSDVCSSDLRYFSIVARLFSLFSFKPEPVYIFLFLLNTVNYFFFALPFCFQGIACFREFGNFLAEYTFLFFVLLTTNCFTFDLKLHDLAIQFIQLFRE